MLYYQVDYTLEDSTPRRRGLAARAASGAKTRRRSCATSSSLKGYAVPGVSSAAPSAYASSTRGSWYGEGEVKVYRDGDTDFPTICGTGLEDYVGHRLGHGRAHRAVRRRAARRSVRPARVATPDFVGFYRWHVADPIMFEREMRVTIQQIGVATFLEGQEEEFARYSVTNPAAGAGWSMAPAPGVIARGIAERVDDFCAAAFVYCSQPQPVPRVDIAAATADIARRDYEKPSPFERMLGDIGG